MSVKAPTPSVVQSREVLEKIHFLNQVSQTLATDPLMGELAQYLSSEMDLTAKKSTIKVKPKSVYCKKCRMPLVPPLCSTVSVNSEFTTIKCTTCGATKRVYHKEKQARSETDHWRFISTFDGKQKPKVVEIARK